MDEISNQDTWSKIHLKGWAKFLPFSTLTDTRSDLDSDIVKKFKIWSLSQRYYEKKESKSELNLTPTSKFRFQ